MALKEEVNGLIPNIHNVFIALDMPMTQKMADEFWNGSKPGISISKIWSEQHQNIHHAVYFLGYKTGAKFHLLCFGNYRVILSKLTSSSII